MSGWKRPTVWRKFSFEVVVEGLDVTLDEEEHQAFHWVTEDECRKGQVIRDGERTEIKWTNESQVAVILEGFRLRVAAQLTSQNSPSHAAQKEHKSSS